MFAETDEQVADSFHTRKSKAVILPIKDQMQLLLGRQGIRKVILENQQQLENGQGSINHFLSTHRW